MDLISRITAGEFHITRYPQTEGHGLSFVFKLSQFKLIQILCRIYRYPQFDTISITYCYSEKLFVILFFFIIKCKNINVVIYMGLKKNKKN